MIRICEDIDIPEISRVINDAAEAYRGIIPADRWKEPYMPEDELRAEIAAGVDFLGFDEDGAGLVGVMGVQDVQDVTLIRHAYVVSDVQGMGIGGALIAAILAGARRPLLIGTWAAAEWAIQFYEKHGFEQVTPTVKDRLLKTYWTIPERQIDTSVVLADARWFAR